jgi:hypothetical protein
MVSEPEQAQNIFCNLLSGKSGFRWNGISQIPDKTAESTWTKLRASLM